MQATECKCLLFLGSPFMKLVTAMFMPVASAWLALRETPVLNAHAEVRDHTTTHFGLRSSYF